MKDYRLGWLPYGAAMMLLLSLSTGVRAADYPEVMRLMSPDFEDQGQIPRALTCQGEDISPALEIQGIPEGTRSLVLTVDDPDAPVGNWVHWVVYDIVPKDRILRGEIPGIQGMNDFRKTDYGGPCPPSGTHHYIFTVYALDEVLALKPGLEKSDVLKAMDGHIVTTARLVGVYARE